MHIVHAASELHPFSKTGGLADMVGALAQALARAGHRVDVVTPLYRGIRARHPGIVPANWRFDLPLGPRLVTGEFWKFQPERNLTLWFVDQPEFFDRAGIYNERNVDYPDNAERFTFFAKAAVLLARHLDSAPQILHCHDWQTGLVPMLVRESVTRGAWPSAPRTLLTIHNLAYQGWFPSSAFSFTNLPAAWFHQESAEAWQQMNCLKAGLNLADALSTVSPRYAQEICTPEFGCGLDPLLRRRGHELSGILNGVDYGEWNTDHNPALPHAYDANHLAGKAGNKQVLQRELGLPIDAEVPLFTNITRLTDQKGADLQLTALEGLLGEGASLQFALLGSGDPVLEAGYRALAIAYPKQVAARIGFDPKLAHRLEAGADFYLMPSRFEPCGLNQLYSLRYGTIPVVRATGGLDDSVIDVRDERSHDGAAATGIKFTEATPVALAHAIRKALTLHATSEWLAQYRRNGMESDFSWERQSLHYVELYDSLL